MTGGASADPCGRVNRRATATPAGGITQIQAITSADKTSPSAALTVRHNSTKGQRAVTLPEKLAAFRANFEAGGPPYGAPSWVHEPMHRATAELVSSGAVEHALKRGDRAPDFTLKNADGRDVSLQELLTRGPAVVTFYRGVWCPYCNLDLQALQEVLPAIEALGVRLVAISPQTQPYSRRSQRDNGITFPILSDPGNTIAARFGLTFKLPDYLIELYRDTFKNDLAHVNGDASWTLPMPARYVIGKDGVIVHAEVSPDYTQRPDPHELLPVLEAITARAQTAADVASVGGQSTRSRLTTPQA